MLENNIRSFSIPSDASSKILNVSKCIESLNQDLGENPTNADIGEALGFDESYIAFLRKFLMPSISLNHQLSDGEDGKFSEIQDLLSDDRNNAKETLIRNDGIECIKKAILLLPQIQKKIIEDRYGLNGEVKTLQEIGKELMISSERVRQIQCVAEQRLLNWMQK